TPLARTRPRAVGGPAAAAAPRVLQGDVLADRGPGGAAGPPARAGRAPGVAGAARPDRRQRARTRLARGGGRVHGRLRVPGDGRVVAVDRAVRAAGRRRSAVPGDGAGD